MKQAAATTPMTTITITRTTIEEDSNEKTASLVAATPLSLSLYLAATTISSRESQKLGKLESDLELLLDSRDQVLARSAGPPSLVRRVG